jgi:hypothetical protein
MFNQVSYNVIVERFKAFAAGHLQIQRFSHGQITTNHLDLIPENTFPWMHVVPVSVQPINGAHAFTFDVLLCDLPRDKENKTEYQREAISDTIRLAEDLLAEVRNGGVIFGEDVVLREGATIVPFMEEYSYVLTGVTLTLTMEFPWDWSACDIPATWTSGGTGHGSGGGGGVGLVLRVNGTNNVDQTILDLVDGVGIEVTDLGDGRVRFDSTGASATWGAITGTLSNQIDLQNILNTKLGSVGLTLPSPTNPAFSVSGSPVTGTAGTFVITANGTQLQYVDGTGALKTFPAIPKTLADLIVGNDKGDLLEWDGAKWVVRAVLSLDNLKDVNAPTPSNGQVLTYNSATNLWVASTYTPPTQVNADWLAVSGVAEILNKPTLAAVATSGDYADLINTPTIPPAQVNADWDATTGVEEVLNKPFIPSVLDDLADVNAPAPNDLEVLTWDKVLNVWVPKPVPTNGLTSVGLQVATAIDAIVITGSPLTSNGDINITSGGNGTQYVDGNLQLQTMPTALPPSGAAGGDLTGTYPNPVVHRIHGTDVQAGTPTDGDVLLYHATNQRWQHQPLNAGQVNNDSGVTGTHVDDALNHLNTTKVNANAAIIPGTNTKITYDAKGLVTGGAALVETDLPTGINATRIGGGLVDNTEYGYLNGVTSAIQTQINNLALPTLNTRGIAVAGVAVGSTAATSCGISLSLPSGTADRTYYIEAVWMLAPTFNPTGGGRVGFSWSGSILNFHGSFQGSASEISYRSVAATAITSGGLFPSNTPYFASDIARNAIAPTTFRGYLDVAANSTTALTLVLAAVNNTATITFYPRGSYLRAIRVT